MTDQQFGLIVIVALVALGLGYVVRIQTVGVTLDAKQPGKKRK